MTYDPQTDPELFHVLSSACGGYWSVNTASSSSDWQKGIVMVTAPDERQRWAVSWTQAGIRGAVGYGDTLAQAISELYRECPWPRALDTLCAYAQARYTNHPSVGEHIVPLVAS
jgi:hypothetical protein